MCRTYNPESENERIMAYTQCGIDWITYAGIALFIPGIILVVLFPKLSILYVGPFVCILIGVMVFLRMGGFWIIFDLENDQLSIVKGRCMNLYISKKNIIGTVQDFKGFVLLQSYVFLVFLNVS